MLEAENWEYAEGLEILEFGGIIKQNKESLAIQEKNVLRYQNNMNYKKNDELISEDLE